MASKGILYAKVKIENIFIHVFTLHAQANVLRTSHDKEIFNNLSRVNQIIESRKIIDDIIKNHWEKNDLGYLMGDFNVNSNSKIYPIKKIIKYFDKEIFQDNIHRNEYDMILYLYNLSELFEISDLYFLNNNPGEQKKFPVTYGDCFENHKGEICPVEKHLTHKIDQISKQCLDFIFQIKINSDFFTKNNDKEKIIKMDVEIKEKVSKNFKITVNKAKVHDFKVSNEKYTHLSDHNGVEFSIKLIK